MRPSVFAILACAVATPALAAEPVDLQKQFHDTVQPFAAKYCAGCHSGATPAAQFDIKSYDSLAKVKAEFPRWALVSERLHAKDMPPKPMKAPPQDELDKIEAVRLLAEKEQKEAVKEKKKQAKLAKVVA